MSFLDNLENSLKSLEAREERDPNEIKRRDDQRARILAAAPWADQLKNSEYTKQLFDKAAAAGHRIRAKVYMAWVDTTLRLEAKGRALELRPTPEGIVAEFVDSTGQTVMEAVDLAGNPEALLEKWLASTGIQREE